MPVKVEKRGIQYRVVESIGHKIAKNKNGSSLDGGGHLTKDKAIKQVQAINISLSKRKNK